MVGSMEQELWDTLSARNCSADEAERRRLAVHADELCELIEKARDRGDLLFPVGGGGPVGYADEAKAKGRAR